MSMANYAKAIYIMLETAKLTAYSNLQVLVLHGKK